MATSVSSSSSSTHGLSKISVSCLLTIILLLSSGSPITAGARSAQITASMTKSYSRQIHLHHRQLHQETGFRYKGLAFGFLPKGTTVPPPGGPSTRQNTAVDGIPKN
ncbi:hypothetical protein SAY87_015845 [Trapa incisa]|uniref:Uncharacterized protein n=1 Tax=Trapa incisa TaxID=236973 RepID=A0AAN7L866_9MYRT|nr:hypothetical protein SAY87_015845 [Trapa incisa]